MIKLTHSEIIQIAYKASKREKVKLDEAVQMEINRIVDSNQRND